MGFLLSAALAIPAKEIAEIIIAENKDIIFLIFSPFLILRVLIMLLIQGTVNHRYIYIIYIYNYVTNVILLK